MPDDLTPFADAVRQLAPQPPHLSRDAILFAAGQASAKSKTPPWLWPGATAFATGVALVLGAFLLTPGESGVRYVDRVEFVYVDRPVTPPATETAPGPLLVKHEPTEADEAERMRQVRRDVLRWGLDMLPAPKPAESGPSDDVTARDVTHWLNLPPGTFALPAQQPKPKKVDEDD